MKKEYSSKENDMVWENRTRITVMETTVNRIEKIVENISLSLDSINLKLDNYVTRDGLDQRLRPIQNESQSFNMFLKKMGLDVLKYAIAGGLLYGILREIPWR